MGRLALRGGQKFVNESELVAQLKWKAQYPIMDDQDQAAVLAAMTGKQLSIPGRSGVVADLEDALCAYYKVPFALTFNCGTAALHAAYMAAGAGPGDEVITSPFTWVTNVTAILAAGSIPVFADIDPHSANIHAESIAKQITPYTKAISVTHLWGHPADMDPIMELAKAKGIVVIEDASQAHGASYRNRKVGTIGHMGCFSLQAGKQMVAGEGGFLIATDRDWYERAMLFGHHPSRLAECLTEEGYKPFAPTGLGFKYRIAGVSAAIALSQLTKLDQWNGQRIRNATRFTEGLQNVRGVRPPQIPSDVVHTYYMYPMTFVSEELGGLSRRSFIEAVRAEGVPLMGNYLDPVHLMPLFQSRRYPGRRSPWEDPAVRREVVYKQGDYPATEQRAKDELLLYFPRFTEYCPQLMDAYTDAIRKVVTNVEELL
jgi:dTDP-4-amino-4,6-dideoxygalactose transaminase